MKTYLYNSLFLSSLLLVSGCGSEVQDLSGNPPSILGEPDKGVFISQVEGLGYTRMLAPTEQLTDKASNYSYRTGELINFHIGNLQLGEAIGLSIISPKEIVAYKNLDLNTSIYSSEVNNRIRLLMELDDDNTIGIQISQATRDIAKYWGTTPNYALDPADFTSNIFALTNNQINITVTKEEAERYFAESLRCVYSGAYTGHRLLPDGTHDGFVGVMIQSVDTEDSTSSLGTIVALSDGQELDGNTSTEEYLFARGKHNMDNGTYIFDQTGEFKDGGIVPSDANVTGDGTSTGYNYVRGTFKQLNPQTGLIQEGEYEATRAFEGKDVAYRYTGYGYGLDNDNNTSNNPILGLFAFDINTDGTIEGMIHDAETGDEPYLSGHVNKATDPISVEMSLLYNGKKSIISGPLDINGTVNLTWSVDNQVAGSLGGVGCQLKPLN